jgi:hypothetical protein
LDLIFDLEAIVAGLSDHKSCWWLQDHLEFGLDNDIHACCFGFKDSAGHGRGHVFLAKIESDRFPADAIKKGRARIHAEITADANDDCRECFFLKFQTWDPRKYLARNITMNPWSHCNLACVYCFTMTPGFKHSKVRYSIPAVIGDMLNGNYVDPSGTVTWGGGDISALPEFNAVSHLFIDYGIKQQFKTSGLKFLKGITRALEEKKGVLEVSLDAGTRETYATYKGKDVWDQVTANIIRYREYGQVDLKYICDFPNVGDADIEGFVEFALRVQPTSIVVTPEFISACGKKFDHKTIAGMSKLIHSLRKAGLPVQPVDDPLGNQLFPHIWDRVKEGMERLQYADTHPGFLSRLRSAVNRIA